MKMNTDYVSLETAKLLKKVNSGLLSDTYYNRMGVLDCFSESDMRCGCDNVRNGEFYAPFLFTAQKWLREEHKIITQIIYNDRLFRALRKKANLDCSDWRYSMLINTQNEFYDEFYGDKTFDTYEQALDIAIQEACKLIKDK